MSSTVEFRSDDNMIDSMPPGWRWFGAVILVVVLLALCSLTVGCASLGLGGGGSDPGDDMRAAFLFDNGGTRAMNATANGRDTGWIKGVIGRQKALGCNTAWLYLANSGDGPGVTSIYADRYGGTVDKAKVAQVRERIELHRKEGLWIVGWLTADDSPDQSRASLAQHLAHVDACSEHLGDLVDEWVVGLEMDEGRGGVAAAMIARCKSKNKGERVGVHLTPKKWSEAVAWGADTLYYQFGFGRSPAECSGDCRRVVAALAGRARFVAAEYHLSSDSAQAKEIGKQVAAVPGVVGTGNGR
jgi:hypothetical protein